MRRRACRCLRRRACRGALSSWRRLCACACVFSCSPPCVWSVRARGSGVSGRPAAKPPTPIRGRVPGKARHAAAPVREPPSPPGAPPLACSRRARRRQAARTVPSGTSPQAPSGTSPHGTACNRPPPPPKPNAPAQQPRANGLPNGGGSAALV